MKEKKLKYLPVLIFFCTLAFNSCGNNGTNPLPPLKPGEMQATTSGADGSGQFYATNAQVQTQGTATYYIVASMRKADNSDDSLVIHLLIPRQSVAPYTVLVSTDSVNKPVVDYCIITSGASCTTYQSSFGVGNAVVKVSSVSEGSNIQGTFSGSLIDAATNQSVTIADGAFYATF